MRAVEEPGRTLVASSSGRPTPLWRRFAAPLVAAVASLGMVAAAVSGATQPGSQMRFKPTGHWVYNFAQQVAFHVDGATGNVDASVPIASERGTQVVQDDTHGYVVGKNRVTRFGKSNLKAEGPVKPAADETPVAIEAAGGPYLVYLQSGKIVRLGATSQVIVAGGAITKPVVTPDGTMWVLRKDAGMLCEVTRTATRLSGCPAQLPAGHTGALTVIATQPHVLDTTNGQLRSVGANGLGAGKPVGVPVSPTVELAPADANGRLPILDPARHSLYLVETRTSGRPVKIDLEPGQYDGPLSSGPLVALVNKTTGTVVTYDSQGNRKDAKKIPPSEGAPAISRGADGRIYVQNGAGTHLLVVGKDGGVMDAPVTGDPDTTPTAPPSAPPPSSEPPSPSGDPGPNPPKNSPVNPTVRQPMGPSAEPASPPGTPTGVTATAGAGAATISWGAARANRAAIDGYVVTWRSSLGATGSRVVSGSTRKTTVSGLANGTSYTFTVAARNRVGTGPAAAADSVTPLAAATAPGGFTAELSGTSANLSWSAPDLRGGTFVRYQVTASGRSSKSTTERSATFTGLSKGSRVTFTVRAITRAPDGRTLTGAAATRSLSVPAQSVTVSRGPHDCDAQYPQEHCYRMHVVMRGFAPNTHYEIKPHSTDSDYGNPGSGQETDSSGYVSFNAFEYYGTGHYVWVTVEDSSGTVIATSGRMLWP